MKQNEKLFKIGIIVVGGIIGAVLMQWFSNFQSNKSSIRIDKIPLNIDTQVQFDVNNDCPYQSFLFPSNLFIKFNVDSYSSTGVSLSFYNAVEDGEYMNRINLCYAEPGESCILKVQTKEEAEFLVANADKISKENDTVNSSGKFFWCCQIEYSLVSPASVIALISLCLLVTVVIVYQRQFE